jgi:hypothetical protein
MRYPAQSKHSALAISFAIALSFPFFLNAQRLTIPETPPTSSTSAPAPALSIPPPSESQAQILKTYPDGTKRIVPLSSLNNHDDGKDFGGPPTLSFPDTTTSDTAGSFKKVPLAPIGDASTTSPSSTQNQAFAVNTTSANSAFQVPLANTSDPMGGSAPIDPLSGAAPATPTPLQTVSGKPAPLSDSGNTIDLGTYDDFFMNACVGGSIQGQLTARRVYNGNNMQAYPLTGSTENFLGLPASGSITAENFTFQPGFRFDTQFGYNIYDWLGVSLESGVIYNALQNYTVSGSGDLTIEPGNVLSGSASFTCSADGELLQVPVQISAIARWPGATAFKPFIGGGVGAIWQQLDVNSINFFGTNVQANYCRSAFQFGFNGQLGANYTVAPGVDFYGVFKLLGAFTPRIGNYDFMNSYNFALEVGIQSRF